MALLARYQKYSSNDAFTDGSAYIQSISKKLVTLKLSNLIMLNLNLHVSICKRSVFWNHNIKIR